MEQHLNSILEDLTDEEFKKFKWHLKLEKVGNIEPIKSYVVTKADREEIADLICQKYESSGRAVMDSVLMKINRNDLVAKLSKMLGPSDASSAACDQSQASVGEKQLMSIRSRFINKVSEPTLKSLMDKLLESGVIGDPEFEALSEKQSRAERATLVIDTVRKKGAASSSILVALLCQEDKFLSKELELM